MLFQLAVCSRNWNEIAELAVIPDRCFPPAGLDRYRLMTAPRVQVLLKPMSDGCRQSKAAFGKVVRGGCGRYWQKAGGVLLKPCCLAVLALSDLPRGARTCTHTRSPVGPAQTSTAQIDYPLQGHILA